MNSLRQRAIVDDQQPMHDASSTSAAAMFSLHDTTLAVRLTICHSHATISSRFQNYQPSPTIMGYTAAWHVARLRPVITVTETGLYQ